MTERFFTNGIPAAAAVTATQQIPADKTAGGSEFITPLQIEAYVEPIVIAATEAALLGLRGPTDKYSADSSTAGFTAGAGEISLACNVATTPGTVILDLTGTLAAGANIQLPTVVSVLGVLGAGFNGQTWILRILNNSSAAFSWTVTGNTGWTLTGSMTVVQSTSRDFLITVTSVGSATASLQNIGSGGV